MMSNAELWCMQVKRSFNKRSVKITDEYETPTNQNKVSRFLRIEDTFSIQDIVEKQGRLVGHKRVTMPLMTAINDTL